jgi:hypothetical protein
VLFQLLIPGWIPISLLKNDLLHFYSLWSTSNTQPAFQKNSRTHNNNIQNLERYIVHTRHQSNWSQYKLRRECNAQKRRQAYLASTSQQFLQEDKKQKNKTIWTSNREINQGPIRQLTHRATWQMRLMRSFAELADISNNVTKIVKLFSLLFLCGSCLHEDTHTCVFRGRYYSRWGRRYAGSIYETLSGTWGWEMMN